jgi:DEAD/DEAH box helicase domain-containing protein
LECGLIEEATILVHKGLAGNPPAAIAEELSSLIDTTRLQIPTKTNGFGDRLRGFFTENKWLLNHTVQLPPREAQLFDASHLPLSPPAHRYIRSQFPKGIYRHQLFALERFLHGENVCLATGTSSGKSMVFYVAAIEHLMRKPKSRVLLVYPLKALGREQEERVKRAVASAGLDLTVGRLDGQVAVSSRAGIVRKSRILIVTPDIIHAWLLSSAAEPAIRDLLRNLGLVVVDEVHNYTGVFGSNAAFLHRRLRHLVGLLGAKCAYISASATIANPEAHVQKLFGIEFEIIGPETDSSPRNGVELMLVTPPRTQDLLSELTNLFSKLASSEDHRFIAFLDSRKQVEYLSSIMRRTGDESEIEVFGRDHLDHMQVLPFRSGYELEDRNRIQDRLSLGNIRGVLSTSALELGIDIPFLDTGVLVGVPLSSTSLLQRIGRIGRHKPGTVLVVNRGDLQDQQAFRDAEKFMTRPLTESSLYLENRRIQYLHALCLARHGGEQDTVLGAESGSDTDFSSGVSWPPGFVDLCKQERIGEIPADLQAMKMEGGEKPNYVFPLRDVESQFQVELKQGPDQRSLGTLSHSQVLREAYPGAVYYYTGKPFRIYRIFQQEKKIQARPENHYTTKPIAPPTLVFPNLSPGNIHSAWRLGDLTAVDCNLQIREVIVGYKERRGPNEFSVQYPLKNGIRFDLPRFTRNYFTTGIVFTHPALSRQGVRGEICAQLIYEAFISLIPFERQDVGAAWDRHRTDRDFVKRGSVFIAIHDQTYGSLRLSSRLLDEGLLVKVLERTVELIDTSEIRDSEPQTTRALVEITREAGAVVEPLKLDGSESLASQTSGAITVIMPGSRGLDVLWNNEEFEVITVFFSPHLHAVAYRGRHLTLGEKEGEEIVAVNRIAPIPGESKFGLYNPETGDLKDLSLQP